MTEQLAPPYDTGSTVAERIANFYDPSGRYDDIDGVLSRLATLKHAGTTALAQTVVLEVGHADLLAGADSAEIASTLDTTPDTVRMAQRQLDVTASHMASAAVKTTAALYDARRDFISHGRVSPLVVAGMVVAAHVHHGVKRRSGKPFFSHPETVTKTVQIAWDQFHPNKDETLDAALFLSLTHDAYEHALPPDNGPYIDAYGRNWLLPSPLVLGKIMTNLGVENAATYAHTSYLLTKTPTLDGTLMDNDLYIQRGIVDPLFCLIKLAETHHNLTLDPDNSMASNNVDRTHDVAEKNARYSTNAITLQNALETFGDTNLMLTGHRIGGVTNQELADSNRLRFGVNLDAADQLLRQYLASDNNDT